MTMLNAINLFVLDKIFKERCNGIKLNASTQMFYIRCLSRHFDNKELKYENSQQFEMFDSDFPNYEKWKPKLQELHRAGLINMSGRTIIFINHWGQYIDRTIFVGTHTDESEFSKSPIEYLEKLKNSQSLEELCCMKNKITKKQFSTLLELFLKEQTELEKVYFELSDVKQHLINWIPYNIDKIPNIRTATATKILGD